MAKDSSSRWVTYTALAAGGCVVGAGLLYYSYTRHLKDDQIDPLLASVSDDQEAASTSAEPNERSSSSQDRAAASAAKPVQPETVSKQSEPASGLLSACGYCKSSDGQLLRCSRCKQAAYCSVDCQRKAWPLHKHACKQLRALSAQPPAAHGVHPPNNRSIPSTYDPTPDHPTENGSAATNATSCSSSSPPSSSPPASDRGITSAVRQYLGQATSSKADSLDNMYETAFFHFVRTEYRKAMELFGKARDMAREAGRGDLQGECCKWLGHCYNKLADLPAASRSFQAGYELGQSQGRHKLVVDCLSGLGCMYRSQNETENALKYLNMAMEAANEAQDTDCRASVECNLGATLMRLDVPAAVAHLRRSVALREEQVEMLHSSGETSRLATAIMEHASASMNLAGGLVAQKEHGQAEEAFVQALKVLEMVEDVDKVIKVLINLANLTELELPNDPESKLRALGYRAKLFEYVAAHQQREPSEVCSICLDELHVDRVSSADQPLIILACYHCLHNSCWQQWEREACPTCKQPVTLV